MFSRRERELTASEREELRQRISSLRWKFPLMAVLLLGAGAGLVAGSFLAIRNPNAGAMVFVAMLGVLGGAVLAALAVMSWLANVAGNQFDRKERRALERYAESGRVSEVEIDASRAWEVMVEREGELGHEWDLKVLLRVSEVSYVLIVDRSGQLGMEFDEELPSRFQVLVWPDGEVYRAEIDKSRPQLPITNLWEEAGAVETVRAGGRLARFVELREDELPKGWRECLRG